MTDLQFTDRHRVAVNDGARRAHRVGRGVVEFDDCQQEAWLWLCENEEQVSEWLDTDNAPRRLADAAYYAGLHLIRATIRQSSGAEPGDMAIYSTDMVKNLLPAIFVEAPHVQADEAPEGTKHRKPPSEGGNLMATVADVKRAFASLNVPQRELLWRLYGQERPVKQQTVAELLDVDVKTVRRRERRAL